LRTVFEGRWKHRREAVVREGICFSFDDARRANNERSTGDQT
jgi:hypothetical protein